MCDILELQALDAWDEISRRIRASMGLGRDRFARLLGVTSRTVMRWENGQNGERVQPQGIQRVKLLALSLNASSTEADQQDVIAVMLDQAAELRAAYERKAATIRTYEIELNESLPIWFEDLSKLKQDQNWSAILLMGPHFIGPLNNQMEALHSSFPKCVEVLTSLWIGIAAFMLGQPQNAEKWYARGIEALNDQMPNILRCVLYSNRALALIRLRRFAEALVLLEKCLAVDPKHRGALRNLLALHSHQNNEQEASAIAQQLVDTYPDTKNPHSELGRLIMEDPDLTEFRMMNAFKEVMPQLKTQLDLLSEGEELS